MFHKLSKEEHLMRMSSFICAWLFMVIALFFTLSPPRAVIAQDTGLPAGETLVEQAQEQPTPLDAPTDTFIAYFESLSALAGAVIAFTEVFKNVTHKSTAVASWIISLALSGVGYAFNLGILADIVWWHFLVFATAAGLIANRIASIEVIEVILSWLKIDPHART